ncbi:hypothetical protein ACF0H5_017567 [Mactra antiquata]
MFYYVSLVCLGILSTTVSATDCPSLWTVFQDSCYLFGHQHLSFVEAEHFCRQHNGNLVRIESAIENDFLIDHVNFMKETSWWIGLTDDDLEGHWVWYGTDTPSTFTGWLPGQPNNYEGKEDCAELWLYNGKWSWNDHQCDTHKITPICEINTNKELPAVVG